MIFTADIICVHILLSESKCKKMHWYKWKKFRIRLHLFRIRAKFRINLFRITVYFFITYICICIIKSSGERKFCPNRKFPDKSCAGLLRFDCLYFFGGEKSACGLKLLYLT
jgi:hypothetical protein